MAINVDNISIQISAEATRAIRSLDSLTTKLSGLNSALGMVNTSGIQAFSTSMQQLSTLSKSVSFTKIKNGFDKIGGANLNGLNNASASIQRIVTALNGMNVNSNAFNSIYTITSSLSQLGGKRIVNASANLVVLANGLRQVMQTLATAPIVNKNIIDMTNALAGLAAQSAGVNSMANNARRNMSQMGSQIKSSSGLFTRLASAIGRVYATYFLFIRGTKLVWKAIKSAMNYTEVLNYFNKAFTQVADKADLSSWQKLGYNSADEYYKSFEKRASEYTTQMTGFASNEEGMLYDTGGKSLGLNPTQVMNTQAVFGQISSSMNVASEDALKLSRVMVELGGDLASVKNEDFASTWKSLQSGLVGMSRSMDKYGVNIREANLNQKLMDMGINATVDQLGQQDKALLRTIVMLDSTRYAWSDMAQTLESPSNQLRLLQSNFTMLSQTIGSLFVPLVTSILPYIRAMTIALTQMLEKLREFLGITGVGWVKSAGTADIMSDVYDSLADDIANASGEAKEFQRQLMGFDEINKLDEKKDNGSATGTTSGLISDAFNKAYEEYQRAWDASYAQVDDKARKLAEKFEKTFSDIASYLKPITDAFGGFAKALSNVADAGSPIGEGFGEGLTILFDFLVNKVGAELLNNLTDALNDFADWLNDIDPNILHAVGEAISALATSILIFKVGGTAITALKNLTTELTLLKGIGAIAIGITLAVEGFEIGKDIGAALFPDIKEYYEDFHWFGEDGFFKAVADWFAYPTTEMETQLQKAKDAISDYEQTVTNFQTNMGNIDIKFTRIENMADEYYKLSENYSNLTDTEKATLSFYAQELQKSLPDITGLIDLQTGAFKGSKEQLEGIIKKTKEYYRVQAAQKFIQEATEKQLQLDIEIASKQEKINELEKQREAQIKRVNAAKYNPALSSAYNLESQQLQSINRELEKVKKSKDDLTEAYNKSVEQIEHWNELIDEESTKMQTSADTTDNATDNIQNFSNALSDASKSGGDFSGNLLNSFDGLDNKLNLAFGKALRAVETTASSQGASLGERLANGISDGIKKTNTIKDAITNAFDNIKGKITLAADKLSGGTGLGFTFDTWAFASGGFPEEGPFFMNRGEIAGKFSNGKGVVANNYQIVEGIKQGVIEAMMIANAGNSGRTVVESNLYLDGTLVAKSVNQANARQDRRFNPITT